MSAAPLPETLLGLAASQPERTALVAGDQRLSYAETRDRALALAARLRAAGLCHGDRVAVVAENGPEYVIAAMATWMAGGVYATVYPSFGASELEYVMDNSRPRLVLVEGGRERAVEAALAASGHVATLDTLEEGSAVGLPEALPLERPEPVDPDEPALICYTSGSTARPKPVTHSHAGLAAASRAYARVWRCGAEDRTLVCLPMAWVYGLVTASMVTLVGGGAVVILPRYNPVEVLAAIERERVTIFPGVTTMFVKLVAYANGSDHTPDLRSLRLSVSGGEPRNEPAFDRWRVLTGCPVHDSYCASEALPVVTYDPVADPEPRPGSAGKVVPEADMRVVDEAGRDVPAGVAGEALWRAPALMLGYWNEPEITASAFTDDGWFRTHDRVRVDQEGYVYVTGRLSSMILRGGGNVSPAEVEAVLMEHPDVVDVSVVGVPDEEYGEAVAAAVVLEPSASLEPGALATFCRARLAPYKIPTRVRVLPELPRNANGKVMRREIVALLGPEDLQTS